MNTPRGRVRIAAIGAPTLLLLYGVLRLIDGLDGHRGPGFAWDVGHTLFLIAIVLLGVLTAGLRQLVPVATRPARVVADLATAAGLIGAACFVWTILGDLFPRLDDAASLPAPLQLVGQLLFQFGMLGLLAMLVATRPRRIPLWTPALLLAGFLLFAINLDLIPVGALIVLIGLSPLARRPFVTWAPAPRASAPEASTPEASTPEASTPEASTPEASTPEATAPEAPEPRPSAVR